MLKNMAAFMCSDRKRFHRRPMEYARGKINTFFFRMIVAFSSGFDDINATLEQFSSNLATQHHGF